MIEGSRPRPRCGLHISGRAGPFWKCCVVWRHGQPFEACDSFAGCGRAFRSWSCWLVLQRLADLGSAGSKQLKVTPRTHAPYELRTLGGLRGRSAARETCLDGHYPLASVLQAASPCQNAIFAGAGAARAEAGRHCRAFVSVRAAARQCEDRSSGGLAALQGRADLSQTESGGAEGSTRHADSAL